MHSRSSENCSHMSGSNTFMLKKHTNKYKGGQDLSPWHSLKSMAEKVFKPISWHSTDKHQQLKEPSTNSCIFPKQLPPMKSLHNTLIINATDYKLMFCTAATQKRQSTKLTLLQWRPRDIILGHLLANLHRILNFHRGFGFILLLQAVLEGLQRVKGLPAFQSLDLLLKLLYGVLLFVAFLLQAFLFLATIKCLSVGC